MNKYYIYIIQNILDNKIYIGQTNKPKTRWNSHKHLVSKDKLVLPHLYRAMKKYGIENFTFTIFAQYNSLEEINEAEEFWIDLFNTTNDKIGYNIQKGGNNKGFLHNEETKKKISLANSGRIFSKEHKEKIRLAGIGRKDSLETSIKRKQRRHSKETLNKMSKSQIGNKNALGKKKSEETKLKMSIAQKGKKHSAERIEKMRLSKIGKKYKTNV